MNFYNYPDVGLKYSPFIDSGATSLGGDGSSFNTTSCTVYERGVRSSDIDNQALTNTDEYEIGSGVVGEVILIQSHRTDQSFLCGDYLTSFCVYFNNAISSHTLNFYVFRQLESRASQTKFYPVFCCQFSRASSGLGTGWHVVSGLCAKIGAMDIMGLGSTSNSYPIPILYRCDYHASSSGKHRVQYAYGICGYSGTVANTGYCLTTCACPTAHTRHCCWTACEMASSYYSSAAPDEHWMNSYPMIRATTHSKPKAKGSSISYFFGGDQPDGLSEYYNGGSYVSDSSVPSSGAIKFSDFYGSGGGSFDDIDLQCVWKKFCECWVKIYLHSINQSTWRQHYIADSGHMNVNRPNIIQGDSGSNRDWDGWCADTYNIGTSSGLNTGLNYYYNRGPFGPRLDQGYSGTVGDQKAMGGIQDGGDDVYDGSKFAGIIWQPKNNVCPILIGAKNVSNDQKPTYRQISCSARDDICAASSVSSAHDGTSMWNYLSWNPSVLFVNGTEGSGAMACVYCITYCNETICFVTFIGERNGTGYNADAGFYGHSSGDTMYPLSLIIKTSKSHWLSVITCANWGSDSQGCTATYQSQADYRPNNKRNLITNYLMQFDWNNSLDSSYVAGDFTLHCGQCIFFAGTNRAYNHGNGDPSSTYSLSLYHSPQWDTSLNNSTHGYLKDACRVSYANPSQTGTWNTANQSRNFGWYGGQMTDSGSADFSTSNYNCNNIFVWQHFFQTQCCAPTGNSVRDSQVSSALIQQLCVIAEDNGGFG